MLIAASSKSNEFFGAHVTFSDDLFESLQSHSFDTTKNYVNELRKHGHTIGYGGNKDNC